MPATRSRTSTEAPEVAVEEKKTTDATEEQPEAESEVKETATEATTETTTEQSKAEEKPVEESTNGSTEAVPSDTNGGQTEEKVENGSAKRKSEVVDEAGDAPDSTDLTPKKAKLDTEAKEETNGSQAGAGEETDKQTPVETSA